MSDHSSEESVSPPIGCIPRAPVSDREAGALRQMAENIESMDGRFYCSGTIEIGVDNPTFLYFLNNGKDRQVTNIQAKALFLGATKGLVRKFHNDWIMKAVSATCNLQVYPVLYKLTSYAYDGFFKVGTPDRISHTLLGTLLIWLPLPFEGGDLILRHGTKPMTFEWAAAVRETPTRFHWTFFFADVEHEILPVTGGYRVTLAYDISKNKKPAEDEDLLDVLDGCGTPLYSEIQKLWNDAEFLSAGGIWLLDYRMRILSKTMTGRRISQDS